MNNVVATAEEKGWEEGLQEGIQKGMAEGLAEGLEKGLEKGEKKKAIEIAKKLLDLLDSETIAEKTGLTIAEIENLKQ
jgi:flagellar biosynthesis/type III secretory pathway protein FliH